MRCLSIVWAKFFFFEVHLKCEAISWGIMWTSINLNALNINVIGFKKIYKFKAASNRNAWSAFCAILLALSHSAILRTHSNGV